MSLATHPVVRDERVVPALPMPASTRRLRLAAAPDAAFDRDVQLVLARRARNRDSDADEMLSSHGGPITAGD